MSAAGWSRKRRSWSKVTASSVRVFGFVSKPGFNHAASGLAHLVAGVSYPSIGEPRPDRLTWDACTHSMVADFLHRHDEPIGGSLFISNANDEAQVEQRRENLAWFCTHLLFPRLELLDDPRELRDYLVERDRTAEALPLCDLLGDREWTLGVLNQHLVQARRAAATDGERRSLTDSGRVWTYWRAVTWSERLGVPLPEQDRALALDAVERVRRSPDRLDDDAIDRANEIADYLGTDRIPKSEATRVRARRR
jgi:hypothetical protein